MENQKNQPTTGLQNSNIRKQSTSSSSESDDLSNPTKKPFTTLEFMKKFIINPNVVPGLRDFITDHPLYMQNMPKILDDFRKSDAYNEVTQPKLQCTPTTQPELKKVPTITTTKTSSLTFESHKEYEPFRWSSNDLLPALRKSYVSEFREKTEWTDLTIVCSSLDYKRTFYVNRMIVCPIFDYFAACCRDSKFSFSTTNTQEKIISWRENELSLVELKECNPHAMHVLLKFAYKGISFADHLFQNHLFYPNILSVGVDLYSHDSIRRTNNNASYKNIHHALNEIFELYSEEDVISGGIDMIPLDSCMDSYIPMLYACIELADRLGMDRSFITAFDKAIESWVFLPDHYLMCPDHLVNMLREKYTQLFCGLLPRLFSPTHTEKQAK